jgi:hypothetical protein
VKGAKLGAPTGANEKQSLERQEEALRARTAPRAPDQPADERINLSGLDAQGQPVYSDVAAAAGVDPAREAGDPYAKQDGPDPARVAAGRKAATDSRAERREGRVGGVAHHLRAGVAGRDDGRGVPGRRRPGRV